MPPGGLPEAFLADVPTRSRELIARYARTHGPFTTEELQSPLPRRPRRGPARARAAGEIVRGELRPGGRSASGATWRCCAGCAAHRWRPCARRSSRPPARAGGLPALLAGRRPPSRAPAPESTACARCSCRCRASRCRSRSGSATCCRGAPAPTRRRGWTALRERRGRVGRRGPARALGPRGALLPRGRRRDRAAVPAPRRRAGDPRRAAPSTSCCARASRGAVLLHRPARRARRRPGEELREALWDLVWAGEVTNDAWAPLRAPRLALARDRAGGSRGAAARAGRALRAAPRALALRGRRTGAHSQVQGRWSLTAPLFGAPAEARQPRLRGARRRTLRGAAARALRHRHPRAGARRGHPRRLRAAVRHVLATSRRSASAAAATSSRAWAAPSSRCPGAVERLRAGDPAAPAASARARS